MLDIIVKVRVGREETYSSRIRGEEQLQRHKIYNSLTINQTSSQNGVDIDIVRIQKLRHVLQNIAVQTQRVPEQKNKR